MNKSIFLGTALSLAMAAPVMADSDFPALRQLSTVPVKMTEDQLILVEGGNPATNVNINVAGANVNIGFNVAVLTQTNACGICFGDQINLGGIGQQ